ncbi:GDP dissociation inhibitor-domain-containing protein [Cunninghamella echinulata]|nr:GDP dissociation inhibitor-domain-containing protein [Cunninghamella echinulata]
MDQLEDTNFDIIVVGTGLIESIVAGSLARSGKKVLHLDSNKQYGSNWSAFNIKHLIEWEQDLKKNAQTLSKKDTNYIDYTTTYKQNFKEVELLFNKDNSNIESITLDTSILPDTNETTLYQAIKDTFDNFINTTSPSLPSSERNDYIQPFLDTLTEKAMKEEQQNGGIYDLTAYILQLKTLLHTLKQSRFYNVDTTPKILPSRGDLVEILIKSGVGRYMEFKSVDDMFIFDVDTQKLEKVPGSKEDIFVNKSISLIDKRKLMKFLTFTMNEEKDADIISEKFKITGKLQSAVIHALALSRSDVTAKVGLEQIQSFMKSIGRFGKGAYLCTLYGGGSEISQAFCRICAVYGGVYILGQALEKYIIHEESGLCTGIMTSDNQEFTASHIITGLDYISPSWMTDSIDNSSIWVSRAVIVTDQPLSGLSQEEQNQSLGISVIPPNDTIGNKNESIYVLNQNSETMACPKDQYITYLWTLNTEESSSTSLKNVAQILLSNSTSVNENNEDENKDKELKPKHAIFELYYQQRIRSMEQALEKWKIPKNIYVCSDPDISIDFENATKEAKSIFYKCVNDDVEFLPPAEEVEPEDF